MPNKNRYYRKQRKKAQSRYDKEISKLLRKLPYSNKQKPKTLPEKIKDLLYGKEYEPDAPKWLQDGTYLRPKKTTYIIVSALMAGCLTFAMDSFMRCITVSDVFVVPIASIIAFILAIGFCMILVINPKAKSRKEIKQEYRDQQQREDFNSYITSIYVQMLLDTQQVTSVTLLDFDTAYSIFYSTKITNITDIYNKISLRKGKLPMPSVDAYKEMNEEEQEEYSHRLLTELSDLSKIWSSKQAFNGVQVDLYKTKEETIQETAELMGIDILINAYYDGVPIDDVIA